MKNSIILGMFLLGVMALMGCEATSSTAEAQGTDDLDALTARVETLEAALSGPWEGTWIGTSSADGGETAISTVYQTQVGNNISAFFVDVYPTTGTYRGMCIGDANGSRISKLASFRL